MRATVVGQTLELPESAWEELEASIAEADRGELIPADVVLAEVRALASTPRAHGDEATPPE